MPGELKRRVAEMEETLKNHEGRLTKVETKVDTLLKGTEYVFQNSDSIEELYVAAVVGEQGGGWTKVKSELKGKLAVEVHAALGLPYPAPALQQRHGDDWPEGKKEWQLAVDAFLGAFHRGNITNVNVQSRKSGDGSFERIKGTFVVVIKPGDETNLAKRALLHSLETAFRQTAGVPVREGDNITVPGREGKQFLVYLNKTASERKRIAKGKGDSKGKDKGKNKGAGKGKKSKAGKEE